MLYVTPPLLNDPRLGGHGFWAPGVALMRRLRFVPKVALLMALMFLGLLWPTAAYVHAQRTKIEFSEKERVGVALLETLYGALLASLELRRDAAAWSVLLIDAETLEASQARWMAALQSLDQARQAAPIDADARTKRLALPAATVERDIQWGQVHQQFESTGAIARALVKFAGQICDDTNLTLDPVIETYYRMEWVCFAGPTMMLDAATVRDLTTLALAADQLGPAARRSLLLAQAGLRAATERAQTAATKASRRLSAGGEDTMPAQYSQWLKAQQQLTDTLEQRVLHGSQPEASAVNPVIQNLGDTALRQQQAMVQDMLQSLDEGLRDRVQRLRRDLYTVLAVAVAVQLLLLYLLASYVRMRRRSVLQLSAHIRRMAQRDLTHVPAVWSGQDELIAVSADLRTLHDEWQMQLRGMQQIADRLRNEHDEAMRQQARGLSPSLVRLQTEALRDLAQQVHATVRRFRLK